MNLYFKATSNSNSSKEQQQQPGEERNKNWKLFVIIMQFYRRNFYGRNWESFVARRGETRFVFFHVKEWSTFLLRQPGPYFHCEPVLTVCFHSISLYSPLQNNFWSHIQYGNWIFTGIKCIQKLCLEMRKTYRPLPWLLYTDYTDATMDRWIERDSFDSVCCWCDEI